MPIYEPNTSGYCGKYLAYFVSLTETNQAPNLNLLTIHSIFLSRNRKRENHAKGVDQKEWRTKRMEGWEA